MSLPIFVFLGSFFGILTAFIGGQRGYNLALMYVTGFITGPLGIAIAYLLPDRTEQPEDPRSIAQEQKQEKAQRSRIAA